MNLELKKAIFVYMCENIKDSQLVNLTISRFCQYIYTPQGNYLIGGELVSEYIRQLEKILK